MPTKLLSGRSGRPRRFDLDTALSLGQAMFHEHGYDAVGLAALTDRLAIRAPSFYAAFGSKAGFFERVLDRYVASVLPLEAILRPGRPADEAVTALLEEAARTYAKHPDARGCLVLEAARAGGSVEAAALARRVAERNREKVLRFVAATHPATADRVRDAVASTMSGLSANAREGWSEERLLAIARTAMIGIRDLLGQTGSDHSCGPGGAAPSGVQGQSPWP